MSIVNFPNPSDVSTETETTETEPEPETVYDGRHDEQEGYWAVVDTERYIQKLCLTYDVGVDTSGKRPYARYNDVDNSPLADHGLTYYRSKTEQADDLADKRESGELEDDQNLPAYKDQFETPEWDHGVVTKENARDYGVDPEFMGDDEQIFVPDEYDLPTDENDELLVWSETPEAGDGLTVAQVLEIADGVKGLGPKTHERLAEALENQN